MALQFIGHRGDGRTTDNPFAGNKAPQNTLLSFRHAIEHGADGVEFDIFLSKDNVPIINDREEFFGKSLSERFNQDIRRFQLAQNQFVPTLDECLRLIGDMTVTRVKPLIINVELKGIGVVERTLAVVDEVFKDYPHLSKSQIQYCSVDIDKLSLLRDREPDAKIQPMIRTNQFFDPSAIQMPGYHVEKNISYLGKYMDDLRQYIVEKNCNGIDVSMLDIRPELVDMATELGIGISTYPSGPRRLTAAPEVTRTIRLLENFSRVTGNDVLLKGDDIPVMREMVNECCSGHEPPLAKIEHFMASHLIPPSAIPA